jgi:hypothetical protein
MDFIAHASGHGPFGDPTFVSPEARKVHEGGQIEILHALGRFQSLTLPAKIRGET